MWVPYFGGIKFYPITPKDPWKRFYKHKRFSYWKEQPIWIVAVFEPFDFKLLSSTDNFPEFIEYYKIPVRSWIKLHAEEHTLWERHETTGEERKVKGWPVEVSKL